MADMEGALLEILSSEDDVTEELGVSGELDRVKKIARRVIDKIRSETFPPAQGE